jgi:nicotinamidase-related amidase
MAKALILVDFENEWIDINSSDYVGNISQVMARTNKLIDYCRPNKYKIIFTRHVEKDSKTAWSEKSNGTKLIKGIHKKDSDILITKYKVSPFYKTNLENELRGIDTIVVLGILTNMCVRSLIQDAYDRDFKIIVIKDCCVSFDKKIQDFTFKDLKNTREEIEFLNLNEFTK